MKTTDPNSKLKDHLKRINNYTNLKLKILGWDDLSKKERDEILKFKIKYQFVLLDDFKSEELISEVLQLSEKIIRK